MAISLSVSGGPSAKHVDTDDDTGGHEQQRGWIKRSRLFPIQQLHSKKVCTRVSVRLHQQTVRKPKGVMKPRKRLLPNHSWYAYLYFKQQRCFWRDDAARARVPVRILWRTL